jgi:hypothetical protein
MSGRRQADHNDVGPIDSRFHARCRRRNLGEPVPDTSAVLDTAEFVHLLDRL